MTAYIVLGIVVLVGLIGLVVQLRILPYHLNVGGLRAYYKAKARVQHEQNLADLNAYAAEQKRKGPQR